MKDTITGQLLFRDVATKTNPTKGMKYMMVLGIVSVQEDEWKVPTDHTVVVTAISPGPNVLLVAQKPVAIPKKFKPWAATDIMTNLSWKINGRKVTAESSRTKDFHIKADRALKIIGGDSPHKGEVTKLIKELSAYSKSLPDYDSMPVILQSILSVLRAKENSK